MIEVGIRVKIVAKFFPEIDLDIIPLWERYCNRNRTR